MSDPSASPPRSFWPPQSFAAQRWTLTDEQEEFLRQWFGIKAQPEQLTVDDGGVVLSLDDTLRCREQALHSASIMFDVGGQFPEDDTERVVAVARRFEKFMRSGQ